MRFLSGAGELLCGGLESGAWEEMASGSGAVGVSPSGASLVRGSTDSAGEPGGKSEQALMVRARRRCWPMCVRFLEKLFLFLAPLTFAGFSPGSSLTSRSGWKSSRHVFICIETIQHVPLCLLVTNAILEFYLKKTIHGETHCLAKVSRTEATSETRPWLLCATAQLFMSPNIQKQTTQQRLCASVLSPA